KPGASSLSAIVAPVMSVLPPTSESKTSLLPSGATSRMSTSSGNVCVNPLSVTVIRAMGLPTPDTLMFDGYGVAGAPVAAPVPLAGIVIAVEFVKVVVCALALVGSARVGKTPRHTVTASQSRRVIRFVLFIRTPLRARDHWKTGSGANPAPPQLFPSDVV